MPTGPASSATRSRYGCCYRRPLLPRAASSPGSCHSKERPGLHPGRQLRLRLLRGPYAIAGLLSAAAPPGRVGAGRVVGGALLLAMVALLAHLGRRLPFRAGTGAGVRRHAGGLVDHGVANSAVPAGTGIAALAWAARPGPTSCRRRHAQSRLLAHRYAAARRVEHGRGVGLYGVASKIYDTCLGLSMLFVGLVGPVLGRRAHVDPQGFTRFSRPAGAC